MQEFEHWSAQDENDQLNQTGESEFSSRQSTYSRPVWASQASAYHSTAAHHSTAAMDDNMSSSPFHSQPSGKCRWPPFSLPILSSKTQPEPAVPAQQPNPHASIFHAPIKTSHRATESFRQSSLCGTNPCLPVFGLPLAAPDTSAVEMPAARQASGCASAPMHSEGAAVATDEEGPTNSAVLQHLEALPAHGHERCAQTTNMKRPRPLHLHGDDTDDVTLLQACSSHTLLNVHVKRAF